MSTSVTTTNDKAWMVGFLRCGSNPQTFNTGTTFRAGANTTVGMCDSGGALTPTGTYSLGGTAGVL